MIKKNITIAVFKIIKLTTQYNKVEYSINKFDTARFTELNCLRCQLRVTECLNSKFDLILWLRFTEARNAVK